MTAQRPRSWWRALLLALGAGATVVGLSPALADRRVERVVLITIDGLRADAVSPAWSPTLAGLLANGAYTLNAQCVTPSVTVPNHVSMLTGLLPASHGFVENDPPPGRYIRDSILHRIRQAGLTVGVYVVKERLRVLADPRLVNRVSASPISSSAWTVARFLEDLAQPRTRWTMTLVHLVEPDAAGHWHGWMSPAYLQAVRVADTHVAKIVQALNTHGLMAHTLLIVTADHGGFRFLHLDPHPEVTTIPWIAVGPGVPAGLRLERRIQPIDIAPTILAVLGLPIPKSIEGTVITEVADPIPAGGGESNR